MKKILVTGGAGFMRSNLVEALLAAKSEKITVTDDFSRNIKMCGKLRPHC